MGSGQAADIREHGPQDAFDQIRNVERTCDRLGCSWIASGCGNGTWL